MPNVNILASSRRRRLTTRPQRVIVTPESQEWFNKPSSFLKPEPIPENHWCYLGQCYCHSHVFNKKYDLERCKRKNGQYGYKNIDDMKICPIDED